MAGAVAVVASCSVFVFWLINWKLGWAKGNGLGFGGARATEES
jgi:hypothetical protein